MCRSLTDGGRRCPACAPERRRAYRSAYLAAKKAANRPLEEAAVILDEPDGAFISSLPPAQLADMLGFEKVGTQVTPQLMAWATEQVETTRAEIKKSAARIVAEHEAKLDRYDAGAGRVRRPARKVFDHYVGWRAGTHTGLYDWLDGLSTAEQTRLRRRWFAEPGNTDVASIDEVEDGGLPIEEWLTETRIIDGAAALSHGRQVKPEAYGGLDVSQMVESPYDLVQIFGTKEEAARAIAEVEAATTEDEAWRMLPKCDQGPAPWQMTEDAYIGEAEMVEQRVRDAVPIEDDPEWGAVFSAEDNRLFDRYGELVPSGLEDPDHPVSFTELYRAILKLARQGGRI
jgi:hypothetical protein